MCPPSAMYANIAWETPRKCEFDAPAKRHVCKNRLGNATKIRIRCTHQAPYMQESLGKHIENTSLMCAPSAMYARIACETQRKCEIDVPAKRHARIAWDTQRTCEFDVPAKRHICKNRYAMRAKNRYSNGFYTQEQGPTGARVTETSLGTLWKINFLRKS